MIMLMFNEKNDFYSLTNRTACPRIQTMSGLKCGLRESFSISFLTVDHCVINKKLEYIRETSR